MVYEAAFRMVRSRIGAQARGHSSVWLLCSAEHPPVIRLNPSTQLGPLLMDTCLACTRPIRSTSRPAPLRCIRFFPGDSSRHSDRSRYGLPLPGGTGLPMPGSRSSHGQVVHQGAEGPTLRFGLF
jgi:hypothetical protein